MGSAKLQRADDNRARRYRSGCASMVRRSHGSGAIAQSLCASVGEQAGVAVPQAEGVSFSGRGMAPGEELGLKKVVSSFRVSSFKNAPDSAVTSRSVFLEVPFEPQIECVSNNRFGNLEGSQTESA